MEAVAHLAECILRPTNFSGRGMNDSFPSFTLRAAYVANQLPRFAWYAGHEMVFRQLAADARRRSGKSARSLRPIHQSRVYADMLALMRQDLANVEAGIYPLPRDHDGPLL